MYFWLTRSSQADPPPVDPGGPGPAALPLPHLHAGGGGVGGEGLHAGRLPQQAPQVGARLIISQIMSQTMKPGPQVRRHHHEQEDQDAPWGNRDEPVKITYKSDKEQ